MKFLLPLLLLFSCCQSSFAQTGMLTGTVDDAQTGSPLAGADLRLDKTGSGAISGQNGQFLLKDIPAGDYLLIAEYIGYVTKRSTVHIRAGRSSVIHIHLGAKSENLGTVNIFGKLNNASEAASRITEKNADNITNIISARAMERSPDINAANVLQRMPGITLKKNSSSDESFSIIRGMEPRYNNTLVNGVKIASPDEKSRFISLNIVPSGLLERITVDKTLLPDMEGDAIGGTVDLLMKNAPDSFSLKADASIGYSQLFFNRQFTYFPVSAIQPLSPLQRNPPGYAAQPGDFSRSNLDFRPRAALPSATFGITYSDRFLKNKLGIVLADNVQSMYYGDISQFNAVSPVNQFTSNKIQSIEVSNNAGSTQQLNNGLVAHIDYALNDHNQFNLDNFYLYTYLAEARLSTDTTLLGTGRTGPGTGQVFLNDRSLIQRQYVENLKISGRHLLSAHLMADWAGVLSEAGKKAPDRATLTNDFLINPDFSKTPVYFNSIERIWQKNNDQDYTGLLNLSYRTAIGKDPFELKTGGLYRGKSRYNTQDLYTLRPPTTNSNGGNTGGKPVFTDIYHTDWSVFNSAGSGSYDPNNYHATEQVTAGYVQARLIVKSLEILAGVRGENTAQYFKTAKQSINAITEERISYLDILPGVHLKYHLTSKENLWLSYFKSISRPEYYELVPYTIRGVDYIEQGNPYLKHAVAQNLDLRYALYPGGEEQLSAGVFYKSIQNPIEMGLVNGGLNGGQIFYTPENYGTAHNYGAELAFTKYWGKIGLTGNYTYTHSAITTPKLLYYKANNNTGLKQTDSLHVMETRPLQGQSDHVLNLSLLYKDTLHKLFAQLSYGFTGKTLSEVSVYYNSDYYQQPMSTLDFSVEKGISRHFTLFGKFNNLLNTATTLKAQGTLTVAQTTYQRSFNIGIRYIH